MMASRGNVGARRRIAIYARVSTADQTADNQLLDLRAECARRGWTDVAEFVDSGISGSTQDRPNLRRLMEAVRKRLVDTVLVWRYDRFARSLSHLVSALDEFRELHIDFASLQEGVDTTTSHGRLVFGILASLAEFERELIKDRIHSGLRRARERGKQLGRPGIPQDKVDAILAWAGKASERDIAVKTGVPKSVVHRVLVLNRVRNVANPLDEGRVAI